MCYTNLVRSNMEGFPSGQRGQTVNLLLSASMVRIHLPPPISCKAARRKARFAGLFLLLLPRDIAQLGSALRSGRRGRRFKSCYPDHVEAKFALLRLFLCKKSSARFLASPLSQKVTLGSSVRL